MTNTVIIMPARCGNAQLTLMLKYALATCKASCDARVMVLDDLGIPENFASEMRAYCATLGYEYRQLNFPRPFSIGRYWNYGAQNSTEEFICYANADVVFFPGWLDHIRQAFAATGDRYCTIQPYSWHPTEQGKINYQVQIPLEPKLVECDHPSCHAGVWRRRSGYVWDEGYSVSEDDCDFWMYMRYHKLKAAIHYGSRVDHLIGQIRGAKGDTGDSKDAAGNDLFNVNRERLRAKWGPLLGITKW